MKTKTIYFLLVLLCATISLRAQDTATVGISGIIIENEKGLGLAGANISLIRSLDSVVHRTVVSGLNGTFNIPAPPDGIYFLSISYVGYNNYLVAPFNYNAQNSIIRAGDIVLQKKNAVLKEVILKSSLPYIEQKIDRVIVNVDAVISNSGATLLDALNNIPGILADELGSISYRGRSGVKVYMDGKPVFLSGNDLSIYLRSLPANSVSKIEIMSNPPAKYNAEGSAGIIDIKTKKIKTQGFNGTLSLGYSQGVYPKSNNAFNFNYRVNKINVYGNLSYSYVKGFFNSVRQRAYHYNGSSRDFLLEQEYNEKSTTKNYSNRIGIDHDISKRTKIGALFSGSINPYAEKGYYINRFISKQPQPDSSILINSRVNIRTVNNAFSMYMTHSYTRSRELSFDVDYLVHKNTNSQYSESDTYFPNNTPGGKYILLSNTPFDAKIYGVKSDYNQQLQKGLKFYAGLQALYSLRNSSGSYLNKVGNDLFPNDHLNNRFNYKENINSAYIGFNKEYKRFSFQSGLRVENTFSNGTVFYNKSQTDSTFTIKYINAFPTAYASYNLDSAANNVLRFSAGRRITRPSYQDLNPSVFFFDKYTSNLGNPLLQPEYSLNFELGYTYKNDFTLTLVYSRTKDIITQVFEQVDSAFISNTINIDRARGMGVNVGITLQIALWWSCNIATELTNNRYVGIAGNNGLLDNNVTTFRITGSNKFKLGEKWNAEINNFYRNSIIFGQVILKPGWQIHTSIRRNLSNNRGAITLTARDIFRSWVVNRDVVIKNANISFSNTFDTHLLTLAFVYKFGKLKSKGTRNSGIDNESSRIKGGK